MTRPIPPAWKTAFRIALIYALFGGLWILFSDRAVLALFPDPATITRIAIVKGWLFVAVTAVLLYALVRHALDQVVASRDALAAGERKYRDLVERANSIILQCDVEGRLTFLNDYGQRFFGYAEAELLGRPVVGTLVPPSESTGRDLDRLLQEIFAEPDRFGEVENENLTRDGRRVWVRWANRAIRDGSGHVAGVLSIGNDVTEHKRAEAERLEMERRLLHAQKLESLGVLAGGIAHDFNNLLTAIIGNLEVALHEAGPESPVGASLQRALEASSRAGELTHQMLAYAGKGPSLVRPTNLSALIEESRRLLRTSVPKNVDVELRLAPDLPAIPLDAAQLQQLVLNLVTNAAEAVGDRTGTVVLATGTRSCDEAYLAESRLEEKPPPGRFVYLEVEDTGCGMDEETRRRLFEPFFTTKFPGRGLGMAAVLGIVRSHGGAIRVASEPGTGTRVQVAFPADGRQDEGEADISPREEPAPRDATVPKGARSPTILIVDDEPMVRTVGGQLLESLGYRVLAAEDGEQAVRMCGEQSGGIDCVLMDLTMPGMGGEEAARQLERLCPEARVILSSGFREPDATERCSGRNLAGFIQKPYRIRELQEAIRRALGA